MGGTGTIWTRTRRTRSTPTRSRTQGRASPAKTPKAPKALKGEGWRSSEALAQVSTRWPAAVAAGMPTGQLDLLERLAPPAPGCAEKVLQAKVEALASHLDLEWYHANVPLLDRRGLPDLIIVGPGGVRYRELKTARGKLSEDQTRWRDRLRAARADWALWRPADWPAIVADLAACAGVENPLSRMGGWYVTGQKTKRPGHIKQSPAEVPTQQGALDG